MIVFTESVLEAPKPPPKRSPIAILGASAASSTISRFRVITYNILSELYATKQVSLTYIKSFIAYFFGV